MSKSKANKFLAELGSGRNKRSKRTKTYEKGEKQWIKNKSFKKQKK